MNIYDHIITYNEEERRAASEWIDRMERRERDRKFLRFLGGVAFMVAWCGLIIYAIWGWMA